MAKILLVDDANFLRRSTARLLIKQGYEVVEAVDGEEAVRLYREVRPDVVLLDIAMAKKNGLTVLAEIRGFDPKARVIMLTAMGQQPILLRALQAGAMDFLIKPYETDQLLESLAKVLG